jgi:hypothetical protein
MNGRVETGPATKPFQCFFHLVDVLAPEVSYLLAYINFHLLSPGGRVPD